MSENENSQASVKPYGMGALQHHITTSLKGKHVIVIDPKREYAAPKKEAP